MGYPFPAGPCSYPAYPGYAGAAYGYAFVVVLLVVLLVIGGFFSIHLYFIDLLLNYKHDTHKLSTFWCG